MAFLHSLFHIIHACIISPGKDLDILAISCDSFDEDTNIVIGRRQGNKHHLHSLHRVRQWCTAYQVAFKINTVVNTHNWREDMSEQIKDLNPVRWKVTLTDAIIAQRLLIDAMAMRQSVMYWSP